MFVTVVFKYRYKFYKVPTVHVVGNLLLPTIFFFLSFQQCNHHIFFLVNELIVV